MITPGTFKPNFSSGEIDPQAAGRTELKTYYSGATRMERMEPIPQGGTRQMPGTRLVSAVRDTLLPEEDITLTVNAGPYAADAVIATYDFGAATPLAALDFTGITCTTSANLRVEFRVSSGDSWSVFPIFLADATERVYRAAQAPNAAFSARYVRLVRVGGSGTVVVSLDAAATPYLYGDPVGNARLLAFATDADEEYDLVVTARNIDVFKDNVWQAAIPSPYGAADMDALRVEQRDATMLLLHEDRAMRKILVQSDRDWLIGEQIFANMPDVDLGGTYTKTPDIWKIQVIGVLSAAQWDAASIELSVNGETTEAIACTDMESTGRDAIATAIAAKIAALPSVGAGVTVVADAPPSGVSNTYPFTITFAGDDNNGLTFEVTGRGFGVEEAIAVNTSRHTRADAGGEPLISSTRGYFRDAEFHQQRLVLAAPKAKGTAFLCSVQGDLYNLNTEIASAQGGILLGLDTRAADSIERILSVRHLVIFAREAEYFVADRSISKTTPTNIVQCSQNGCARNVPVVVADDALFYVGKNGNVVFAAQYSDVAQAYQSSPISLLASHMIYDIVDAAFQRSRAGTDGGRYLLVRDDGTLIVGTVIREQEVTGFVRWPTDGEVVRVMTTISDEVKLLVRRTSDGADRIFFERWADDTVFDQTTTLTYGTATRGIEGLTLYEDETVWAKVDGAYEGPFTVSGGGITLENAGLSVEIGRWTPPLIELLPPAREIGQDKVLRSPARVTAVDMTLVETSSIALGANGGTPANRSLYRAAAMPAGLEPEYSGDLRIAGLRGYAKAPTVVVTQTRPGALALRDITIEWRG